MSGGFNRDRLPDWLTYTGMHGINVEGKGAWRSILCPFHDDTHASLRINTKSGGWCCMSCQTSGGDTLSFYMQMTGLGFVEAATMLGAWEGDTKPTGREKPRRLSASDALQLLHRDIRTAYLVISDQVKGLAPNHVDQAAMRDIAHRVLVVYEGVNG